MATKVPKTKSAPFPFFLEAAGADQLLRKPMFGAFAFYRDEKILFIVRERESSPLDNGIWVVAPLEHQKSLREILPSLRQITFFTNEEPAWLNLPADSENFEDEALSFAELVLNCDERVGRIPKQKKKLMKNQDLERVKKRSPKIVKKKSKMSQSGTKKRVPAKKSKDRR